MPDAGLATQCVHGGVQPDPAYGAVMPPLYLSSTFAFKDICTNAGYDYTRSGNPTRTALEEALALLEGGQRRDLHQHGHERHPGGPEPAGTRQPPALPPWTATAAPSAPLEHARRFYGLEVTYLDLADLAAAAGGPAARHAHDLDRDALQSRCCGSRTSPPWPSSATASRTALVAVDNTFLSPVFQRPFALGADLVIHSTTKYLNGHSDVVGGAVVSGPGRQVLTQQIQSVNNLLGTSQSPHDCFLVLRGLKTLPLRMRPHEATAQQIAEFLLAHPAVAKVHYPGLPSHPQHDLARRQQRGFGGMLSFELKEGGNERLNHVLRRLRWFTLAESLGGVEALVAHPASMTHASMTPEARRHAGISDGLIRLSVGLEDVEDLRSDLAQALTFP